MGDLHRYVGVNVLLVEYRGYGRSEGSPSESGKILQVKVDCGQILFVIVILRKRDWEVLN